MLLFGTIVLARLFSHAFFFDLQIGAVPEPEPVEGPSPRAMTSLRWAHSPPPRTPCTAGPAPVGPPGIADGGASPGRGAGPLLSTRPPGAPAPCSSPEGAVGSAPTVRGPPSRAPCPPGRGRRPRYSATPGKGAAGAGRATSLAGCRRRTGPRSPWTRGGPGATPRTPPGTVPGAPRAGAATTLGCAGPAPPTPGGPAEPGPRCRWRGPGPGPSPGRSSPPGRELPRAVAVEDSATPAPARASPATRNGPSGEGTRRGGTTLSPHGPPDERAFFETLPESAGPRRGRSTALPARRTR